MSYHDNLKMRAHLRTAIWKYRHAKGKMPRRIIVPKEVLFCLMKEKKRTFIGRVYKIEGVVVEVRRCFYRR